MSELKLKYILRKNSYGTDIVYVCPDDHKCFMRGCKTDLDDLNPLYATIPFDYAKKFKCGDETYNYYCIGFNWSSKLFKFIPNYNTYRAERQNGTNTQYTSLTTQFYITILY